MTDAVAFQVNPTSEIPRSTASSAFQRFLKNWMGRNSSDTRSLPRKLASTPFAASLLAPPFAPEEVQQRRLQLQRIVDIIVLDSTRDKRKDLVIKLKLSLKPTAPREQVGIFVPNNAPVIYETTITFRDVNQLDKVLAFCIDKMAGNCRDNCGFCSRFRKYLGNYWVKDPLVTVINMGDTVLRKVSLAMHLAHLVAFATGKHTATPRVTNVSNNKQDAGVQIAPLSSHERKRTEGVDVCAAQNEITVVLYNFFDVFKKEAAASTSAFC
ncbi:hypothetical protein PC128_g507 [Phytophthora cactorum]|nr:hypothetical protein PC120_g66 [Phytophthora cactorum]KAG3101352.1 hypothetical protein PC121_g1425 [Phytophthora cactorum]KAG3206762.1 hypothetical protein PC128_g507 [Phytophthora cactorum]KAG4064728.1 hypothetical protein PC123_g488 [Phytophthora cactorum]